MSWGYGSASVELVGGKPGVMEGWIEVGLKVRKRRESRLEGPEILEEVERVEGIEPSTKAWEAFVLPLNYTRITRLLGAPKRGCPIRTLVISLFSWSNAIVRHPLRAVTLYQIQLGI